MGADQLFELRRRTFGTPGFRGVEFIEVEAKSVINRVPGRGVPFDWSINPYRGCSHACRYCVSGGTDILLADGRTMPIAKVRVGDRIYGTRRDGTHRRYVPTDVLVRWDTVERAYRITLADGTRIIASGDHRFLTEQRGWKYVTGREQGRERRPFLTTDDSLLGVGGFATPPVEDRGYQRGYLTGMIRGDGQLASHPHRRKGRTGAVVHQLGRALVDGEALERTAAYLAIEGIGTGRSRSPRGSIEAEPRTWWSPPAGCRTWPPGPREVGLCYAHCQLLERHRGPTFGRPLRWIHYTGYRRGSPMTPNGSANGDP